MGFMAELQCYRQRNVNWVLISFDHPCIQASLGPFPWPLAAQGPTQRLHLEASGTNTSDDKPKWAKCLSMEVLKLPRTMDIFQKIEADRFLSYRLPSPKASAGAILHHAAAVFDGLHIQKKPMTFKFGFSHCAHFRWHNSAFGYKHDLSNKFEHLMVVYVASDPIGPAFLEAALIQRYHGYWTAPCMTMFVWPPLSFKYIPAW